MKKLCVLTWVLVILSLILPINLVRAQTETTNKTPMTVSTNNVDFKAELDAVTAQLKDKFDQGKTNGTDLQESLDNIKALILKHFKNGNREQVARLYLLDAHIYADGLNDKTRALDIWEQVARDFPGTMAAKGAAISMAQRFPEGLDVGQRFPDFNVMDTTGAPLSVAAYHGHVTMVDFWATWCGPCRGELPNVITTYQKYHAQGFDIIGISLDDDQNALASYTQAQGMTWRQYCDWQEWQSPMVKTYGISGIPMDYLLDRHGIIIGKELRGPELGEAVAKAVANQ